MAEIDSGGGGGKHKGGGKVRGKKASTRVDMTPMVDLGFLLITFFILATTLNKPTSMTLNVPDKTEKQEETEPIKASKVMTIFLGQNNEVHYIFGKAANEDPDLKTVRYGQELRDAIQTSKNKVGADFVVVIKPTAKSTYRNMVDILDEMAITKTKRYSLVDQLTPDENKLIAGKLK